MPTLGELTNPTNDPALQAYIDKVNRAQHVLLIGASKSGKSDWVAQAAKDGFDVIYFDNDNGLPTLLEALQDDQAALSRVHYFQPEDFLEITTGMLESPQVRYNERTRLLYQPHTAKDDDIIKIIWPNRIPLTTIVTWDSWTSLCYAALSLAAKNNGVKLTDIDKYGREIYGPAGFKTLQFAEMMKYAPFNLIVQAHPAVYEIKEKPAGFNNAQEIKEKDMIIKETWDIPQGTSNPNGHAIGKNFNQIGWLELNRFDKFELSFKAKHRRTVGGTPQSAGDPRTTHSYRKLFGKGLQLPSTMTEKPWIETLTAAELKARLGQKAATPAAVKPATPTPTLATKPIVTGLPTGLTAFTPKT